MKVIRYGLVFALFFSASLLMAEEAAQIEPPFEAPKPLQVIVTGVKGDELKNVQLALTPPTGLVHEDKVDRLWLERFKSQIPESFRRPRGKSTLTSQVMERGKSLTCWAV